MSDLSTLEIIATISLVIYVLLAASESPWCWPASIIGVICYSLVMYQSRLYLEVALYGYYLAVSVFGVWYWLRGGKQRTVLLISRTALKEWLWLGAATIAATVAFALMIKQFDYSWMQLTDVPWWDALTTVASLAATYLLLRKRLENWIVWIVVDSIYVPLMLYKELYFFAGLYGFYLIVCVFGWMNWRSHLKLQGA